MNDELWAQIEQVLCLLYIATKRQDVAIAQDAVADLNLLLARVKEADKKCDELER